MHSVVNFAFCALKKTTIPNVDAFSTNNVYFVLLLRKKKKLKNEKYDRVSYCDNYFSDVLKARGTGNQFVDQLSWHCDEESDQLTLA